MYAAIRDAVPDAAFAIFTGDIVDHAVWNTTEAYNTGGINHAYDRMRSSGLKLVYGTAGNHEAHPAGSFPPAGVGKSAQWVYDLLSSNWSPWIGSSAANEVKKSGRYSAKYPHGKLRVLSLNSNMYYAGNLWLYQDPMEIDPNGQIAWLVRQLDAAERDGERVYIIGHHPPGEWDAFHDYSNHLDQVVNRYSSTIAAMFFGHTHKDHFTINYADYAERTFDNTLVTAYIGPSLTPLAGMPSFTVYTVDPVTFAVLDAETYSADMEDPSFQTLGPIWRKYYSAKQSYGPLVTPPLSVAAEHVELSPAF
jgi:sphingomyelin phosphodiesterase